MGPSAGWAVTSGECFVENGADDVAGQGRPGVELKLQGVDPAPEHPAFYQLVDAPPLLVVPRIAPFPDVGDLAGATRGNPSAARAGADATGWSG